MPPKATNTGGQRQSQAPPPKSTTSSSPPMDKQTRLIVGFLVFLCVVAATALSFAIYNFSERDSSGSSGSGGGGGGGGGGTTGGGGPSGSIDKTFLLPDLINVLIPEFPVAKVEIKNNGPVVLRINEEKSQFFTTTITPSTTLKFDKTSMQAGETMTVQGTSDGIGAIHLVVEGKIGDWTSGNVTVLTTRTNNITTTTTLTPNDNRENVYLSLIFVEVRVDANEFIIANSQ
jgi:hypothetical protein